MVSERPVVIIGAGLAGAATAWALSRRGVPVVVLEQFAAEHPHGSSHGSARIVRRAYADGLYVSLTGLAFELWRELELSSGAPLLRLLGGLDFGLARRGEPVPTLLAAGGVEHEVLSAGEAARRWPGMEFEGDVVFHPQAGTLDSGGAVNALLQEAARLGAVVRHSTPVTALAGDRVTLVDGSSLVASTVVVAAGGWLAPLLAGAVPLPPLRVTQQQVFHFPRLDPSEPPWPSVIHEPGGHPIYHLAGGRDGGAEDDRKVGEHGGGVETTAATRDGVIDPASRGRVVEYVKRWLPGLDPTPRSEASCLYTSTPTENFLIDRVGDVVVCSPCSGHGAKFAPLIGEYVAGVVLGADDELPAQFRLAAHASGAGGAVSL
jgi:glycine/D-amino acid oxidase-like deaminating enzyme